MFPLHSSFSSHINRLILEPVILRDVGDPILFGIHFPRRTTSNLVVAIALGTFLFDLGKRSFKKVVSWAAGNVQRNLREMIRLRSIVQREIAQAERKRRRTAREFRKMEKDHHRTMENLEAFEALPFAQHTCSSLAQISMTMMSQATLAELRRQAYVERCKKLKEGHDELEKEIDKTTEMIEDLLS